MAQETPLNNLKEMTDLEKFIDTYKQFGIKIETNINYNGNIEIWLHSQYDKATNSEKFYGYSGCQSDLEFTKEGKFIRQGFWEG